MENTLTAMEAKRAYMKTYQQKYRANNVEKLKKYQKEWRAKNRGKCQEYEARYWEKKALEAEHKAGEQ